MTVSQPFLIFHNLHSLEEYWSFCALTIILSVSEVFLWLDCALVWEEEEHRGKVSLLHITMIFISDVNFDHLVKIPFDRLVQPSKSSTSWREVYLHLLFEILYNKDLSLSSLHIFKHFFMSVWNCVMHFIFCVYEQDDGSSVPRTCAYYFTWQKRLQIWLGLRDFRWGNYSGLPWWVHSSLRSSCEYFFPTLVRGR